MNKSHTIGFAFGIVAVVGIVGAALGALLGVMPGFPVLTYNSTGNLAYSAAGTALDITASPLAIRFSPTTPPRVVQPTGDPASAVLTIHVRVDHSGGLIGGVPGDDLVIQGQVDADGNGSVDYAGVLLTGEVRAFGFLDAGATDQFDFRFSPTGGSLMPFYAGKDIGVVISSEHSSFAADFSVDFAGGAKGSVGPIDRQNLPPVCEANGPYEAQCAGAVTTLSLDGTLSHDPDGDPLLFSWSSTCPGATFLGANTATPTLSIDTSSGCDLTCDITLTVSDGHNPPVSCTTTAHVADESNPVIDCPGDVSISCDASLDPAHTGTASARDDCDPQPEVTYADEEIPGLCAHSRSIRRTWTARDRCGNSAKCIQTISVADTTPPTITACPADRDVDCSEGTDPSLTGLPAAVDNCDPEPVATYVDETSPSECPSVSVVTRTWTVRDACGNADTCVQTIRLVDNSAPTVHCPPDATVECTEPTDPSRTGTATASDSCDPNPAVFFTDTVSGVCPRVITRRWKARDVCGRVSTPCEQTITVVDTRPPVITCPPDLTLVCSEPTDPGYTGVASATDDCDPNPHVTYTDTISGSCPGVITRVWKAVDACNNEIRCTQRITRVSNEPCPATPGYWKNHRSRWPTTSLTIGGVTYNATQLANMLDNKRPNGGNAASDASVILAKFVIAATFNVLTGSNPQNILPVLQQADALLAANPPGSNPRGAVRQQMLDLKDLLDAYCNSNPPGCIERN